MIELGRYIEQPVAQLDAAHSASIGGVLQGAGQVAAGLADDANNAMLRLKSQNAAISDAEQKQRNQLALLGARQKMEETRVKNADDGIKNRNSSNFTDATKGAFEQIAKETLGAAPVGDRAQLQFALDIEMAGQNMQTFAAQQKLTGAVQKLNLESLTAHAGEMAQNDPRAAIAAYNVGIEAFDWLGPEEKAAMRGQFAGDATFSNLTKTTRLSTDMAMLQQLRSDIYSHDKYPHMQDNQRNAIEQGADQRIRELAGERERDRKLNERTLTEQTQAAIMALEQNPSNPALHATVFNLSNNPDNPSRYAARAASENTIIKANIVAAGANPKVTVDGKRLPALESFDADLEANIKRAAEMGDAERVKVFTAQQEDLRQWADRRQKLYAADQLAGAAQDYNQGRQLTSLNPNAELLPQLIERVKSVKKLEASSGMRLPYLYSSEGRLFKDIITSGSTEKIHDTMRAIKGALGNEALMGFVMPMAGSEPGQRLVGMAARLVSIADPKDPASGVPASKLLIDAYKANKDPDLTKTYALKGDEEKAALEYYMRQTKGAFNSIEEEAAQRESFLQVLNFYQFKDSATDGAFNKERAEKALRATTGGVYGFNGGQTIPPYGWPVDKFEANAANLLRIAAKRYNLPDSIADDGQLVFDGYNSNGGNPIYKIRLPNGNGSHFVTKKQTKMVNGQPVETLEPLYIEMGSMYQTTRAKAQGNTQEEEQQLIDAAAGIKGGAIWRD